MKAAGGPQEDMDGGFKYGGWVVPHFDEQLGQIMHEQMTKPLDLLLGRRTYEIFASYWPTHESEWPGINSATKYVVSATRTDSLWDNTVFIKDNAVEEIRRLKRQDGPDLQVHGSSQLLQTLFKHDLVDELWVKIAIPLVARRLLLYRAAMHRRVLGGRDILAFGRTVADGFDGLLLRGL